MIIDLSGRGPAAHWLGLLGVAMVAVTSTTVYLLGLRYTGAFADTVEVTALMTSTGDGLPQHADVKFRGMLVGAVGGTEVAPKGARQRLTLRIEPGVAESIPDTATVRTVPTNIFGVTAVELVDNGPGRGLRAGVTLQQDTSAATAQLQTTLTTLSAVLDAIDPMKLARVLGTLADALDPAARLPGSTIERLDTWTTEVRSIPGIGDLLGNLGAAAAAVNRSTPRLIDSLTESVTVARTLTERRAGLVALLTAAGGVVDTTNQLFARNPGAGPALVSGLNETFGALAADPDAIAAAVADLNTALAGLATVFNWGPSKQMRWAFDVSFTPFKQYAAADCPHYGALAGPRCGGPSVPDTAPAQEFPAQLWPGRISAAGPVPSPTIPFGLPALPGGDGIRPASTGPGELRGADAIAALVGGTPTPAQLLLLGPVLWNGAITVSGEGH
ncbi:MlaD family protein [Nocardia tengchongensis]|uniref:MlaD family protein n=1 Tax=Nocardia tengchongensis TaxID=2055889 RepID=UPI0036982093